MRRLLFFLRELGEASWKLPSQWQTWGPVQNLRYFSSNPLVNKRKVSACQEYDQSKGFGIWSPRIWLWCEFGKGMDITKTIV